VLFGAAGDLARRKLIPGLLSLFRAGLLPECRIVGTSLEALDSDGFRAFAHSACHEFARSELEEGEWSEFAAMLRYVPNSAGAARLAAEVEAAERELGEGVRRLHYLSVPPFAAQSAVGMLGEAGLAERASIVMEKPFGTDLASAKQLNAAVHAVFDEEQVFRIDHFLGKEAAQNILALPPRSPFASPRRRKATCKPLWRSRASSTCASSWSIRSCRRKNSIPGSRTWPA
jgi:glucose-6-phosphate 1-dehydrogenase